PPAPPEPSGLRSANFLTFRIVLTRSITAGAILEARFWLTELPRRTYAGAIGSVSLFQENIMHQMTHWSATLLACIAGLGLAGCTIWNCNCQDPTPAEYGACAFSSDSAAAIVQGAHPKVGSCTCEDQLQPCISQPN